MTFRPLSFFITNTSVIKDSLIYVKFPGTHSGADIKCCWEIIHLVKDETCCAQSRVKCSLGNVAFRPIQTAGVCAEGPLKFGAAHGKALW